MGWTQTLSTAGSHFWVKMVSLHPRTGNSSGFLVLPAKGGAYFVAISHLLMKKLGKAQHGPNSFPHQNSQCTYMPRALQRQGLPFLPVSWKHLIYNRVIIKKGRICNSTRAPQAMNMQLLPSLMFLRSQSAL